MTTASIAEVLKLAAKPVQYDNDEKTWLEFSFKLENFLTLVDERDVALLLNAEQSLNLWRTFRRERKNQQ